MCDGHLSCPFCTTVFQTWILLFCKVQSPGLLEIPALVDDDASRCLLLALRPHVAGDGQCEASARVHTTRDRALALGRMAFTQRSVYL